MDQVPFKGSQYKPSGELQGDTKEMKDRGTRTGVTDTYGADIDVDSTNRLGSLNGGAKSDKADPA